MKANQTFGIILGAGRIDENLIPVFGDLSTANIPLNGRTSIFYTLDFMISMGISEIYVCLGYRKERIQQYIEITYGARADIIFVDTDYRHKPGMSLLNALEASQCHFTQMNALIMLSDTLLPIHQFADVDFHESFVVTSDVYDISERWCVVKKNNEGLIEDIYNKEKDKYGYEAVVGMYYFKNPWILMEFTSTDIENTEISDLMTLYIDQGYPIATFVSNNWYDLGHLDMYQKAKRQLLYHRYFNEFQHNDLLGTITKQSTQIKKIENEILWMEQLPKALQPLVPRIFSSGSDHELAFVEMEYYGYPPLSELWLYGMLGHEVWETIFSKLFGMIDHFMKHKKRVDIQHYTNMYHLKTNLRIEEAKQQSAVIYRLLEYPSLIINDHEVSGWPVLESMIQSRYQALFNESDHCVIHGDLCFSNILYDLRTGIIRLIDPRGDWGGAFGIGDIKYDLAKLRHSISGDYDFIVQDLFSIDVNNEEISLRIASQDQTIQKAKVRFDQMLSRKWSLTSIQFIEGLLFLSMIPLHSDSLSRQIAMLSKGIWLLNGVMNEEGVKS